MNDENPSDLGLDETLAPSSDNELSSVSNSSAHPTDPLIGRVLDERYRVEKVLGGGGFGMVYMGVQLRLDSRPCVIKVARPELAQSEQFAARFEREKRAMMSLQSRNTVQIIDYGRTDDAIDYIVMEFIEGKELADVLHPAYPMDQRRVLHIARGICNSLEEAHAAGILHRDLKPGNVMLVDLGNVELVKVIDFGIARLGASDEGDFKTKTGEMPGTPAYSSFEQLMGQSDKVDERTDIYSLGAMLYEMLTGVVPFGDVIRSRQFDSRTLYFVALAQAKATRNPTPIETLRTQREVHPELRELVFRMLDRSSINRPRDMKEIQAALTRIERALAATPSTFDDGVGFEETAVPDSMSFGDLATKVETPDVQPIQPTSKKTLWVGLGVGGVLIALALLFFLLNGRGATEEDPAIASQDSVSSLNSGAASSPGALPTVPDVVDGPRDSVVLLEDVLTKDETRAEGLLTAEIAPETAEDLSNPADLLDTTPDVGADDVRAVKAAKSDVTEDVTAKGPAEGSEVQGQAEVELVPAEKKVIAPLRKVPAKKRTPPWLKDPDRTPKGTVKKGGGGAETVKQPANIEKKVEPKEDEKPKEKEKPKEDENMSDKMELM